MPLELVFYVDQTHNTETFLRAFARNISWI